MKTEQDILAKLEEVEKDLDDIENSRRDYCDRDYQKMRQLALKRRRYWNKIKEESR